VSRFQHSHSSFGVASVGCSGAGSTRTSLLRTAPLQGGRRAAQGRRALRGRLPPLAFVQQGLRVNMFTLGNAVSSCRSSNRTSRILHCVQRCSTSAGRQLQQPVDYFGSPADLAPRAQGLLRHHRRAATEGWKACSEPNALRRAIVRHSRLITCHSADAPSWSACTTCSRWSCLLQRDQRQLALSVAGFSS
jgi:hypothetical protein